MNKNSHLPSASGLCGTLPIALTYSTLTRTLCGWCYSLHFTYKEMQVQAWASAGVVCGFSCMWDFISLTRDQTTSPELQGVVLTTGPPQKSPSGDYLGQGEGWLWATGLLKSRSLKLPVKIPTAASLIIMSGSQWQGLLILPLSRSLAGNCPDLQRVSTLRGFTCPCKFLEHPLPQWSACHTGRRKGQRLLAEVWLCPFELSDIEWEQQKTNQVTM